MLWWRILGGSFGKTLDLSGELNEYDPCCKPRVEKRSYGYVVTALHILPCQG